MEIAGAHALVTGASRGIGQAIAEELAAKGASVTLAARSTRDLTEVAERIGGTAITADLAEATGRDGLIARAEDAGGAPLDILVNNAGVDMAGNFAEMSAGDLERLLSVNVLALMELTRQAIPGMIGRGRGYVVNISSLAAAFPGHGMAAYSGSKAAISQFTASLRFDLDGTGVGAMAVEVGFVETDMRERVLDYEPMRKSYERLKRMGALVDTPLDTLAKATVSGIEKDRASVRYPGRTRPMLALVNVPRRTTWLVR